MLPPDERISMPLASRNTTWQGRDLPLSEDLKTLREALRGDDVMALKDFYLYFGKNILEKTRFERQITPLMSAAYHGSADCLRYLIAQGVDAQAADEWNRNAVYHAALGDQHGMVPILHLAGTDLNTVCTSGMTALLQTAWNGKADTFRVLLECGADTDICVNGDGESVGDLVLVKDNLQSIYKEHLTRAENATYAKSTAHISADVAKGLPRPLRIRKLRLR